MKKTIAVLTIILLIPLLGQAANQPDQAKALDKVTTAFFSHMANLEYDKAASLFHYPTNYTEQERASDAEGVARLLSLFSSTFGTPSTPKPIEKPPRFLHMFVNAGTEGYWVANPDFIRKDFSVAFSNEGDGLVLIQLTNIGDKWELRAVAYALPADSPDAQKRMMKIGQTVMAGMQAYTESLSQ